MGGMPHFLHKDIISPDLRHGNPVNTRLTNARFMIHTSLKQGQNPLKQNRLLPRQASGATHTAHSAPAFPLTRQSRQCWANPTFRPIHNILLRSTSESISNSYSFLPSSTMASNNKRIIWPCIRIISFSVNFST